MKYIFSLFAFVAISCAPVEKTVEPATIKPSPCDNHPAIETEHSKLIECKELNAVKCECSYTAQLGHLSCIVKVNSIPDGKWGLSTFDCLK